MVKLASNEICTGCAACYNRCKKNAIKMVPNDAGFLYPLIEDSLCVNCGKCADVCPVLKENVGPSIPAEAWIMQRKCTECLDECASGGFFFTLADSFIQQENSAVSGAIYSDNFFVEHTIFYDNQKLHQVKGSKYVQSDIGLIYRELEKALIQGKQICFSGTPCQVAGLKSYLKKEYDNLLTVDFLCHSVPSPKAWKLYLRQQSIKYGEVIGVQFKSKHYGYTFPTLKLSTLKKQKVEQHYFTSQSDAYMRAFLSGKISRDSCNDCHFRKEHVSDITIADYYKYTVQLSTIDKSKGVSRIVAWSSKGIEKIECVLDKFNYSKIPVCEVFDETDFEDLYTQKIDFEILKSSNETEFFKKNFKVGLKAKMLGKGRIILYKLGLQDFVKKLVKGK